MNIVKLFSFKDEVSCLWRMEWISAVVQTECFWSVVWCLPAVLCRLLCAVTFVDCCLHSVLLCSEVVSGSVVVLPNSSYIALRCYVTVWHSSDTSHASRLQSVATLLGEFQMSHLVSSHAVWWIMVPAERTVNHTCCGAWNIKHHTPWHTVTTILILSIYLCQRHTVRCQT
jgi:hypothetical protein